MINIDDILLHKQTWNRHFNQWEWSIDDRLNTIDPFILLDEMLDVYFSKDHACPLAERHHHLLRVVQQALSDQKQLFQESNRLSLEALDKRLSYINTLAMIADACDHAPDDGTVGELEDQTPSLAREDYVRDLTLCFSFSTKLQDREKLDVLENLLKTKYRRVPFGERTATTISTMYQEHLLLLHLNNPVVSVAQVQQWMDEAEHQWSQAPSHDAGISNDATSQPLFAMGPPETDQHDSLNPLPNLSSDALQQFKNKQTPQQKPAMPRFVF